MTERDREGERLYYRVDRAGMSSDQKRRHQDAMNAWVRRKRADDPEWREADNAKRRAKRAAQPPDAKGRLLERERRNKFKSRMRKRGALP